LTQEVLQCFSIPVPQAVTQQRGWLLKEKRKGGWHKRFFVLFRHTLVWYKNDKADELAQGALTLADSNVVRNEIQGHPCLEITSPLALLMRTNKETSRGRVFRLRSNDVAELENWQHALIQANTKSEGSNAWPTAFVDDKWVL
jgi:hypothetical protein